MTWVDFVIALIFVASAVYGFWRGFAKEAIALCTWLAALWLAWQSSWIIEPMLGDWTVAPELRIWAARAVIFIAVLLVGGLAAYLLRALIRHSGLSGTDRSLGGVFGLLRAVIIVGLIAIGVQLAGLEQEDWWQSATFRPFSNRVADGIRYYVELGGRYLADSELV